MHCVMNKQLNKVKNMSVSDKQIISPVDRKLIKEELNEQRFVRKTNHLDNEIYIVDAFNSPHVMKEIGRLREISFRMAGGGTGDSIDIDDFDTHENAYQQLIVYSPEDEEIIGGYRYIDCGIIGIDGHEQDYLSTAHYFNFSKEFKRDYLPYTIELGRSWIQPEYQSSVNPRKGLFALSNLWDGLGALVTIYPQIKYFFGKVTMYSQYDSIARDILLTFMHYYFPDDDKLVTPINPLHFNFKEEVVEDYFKNVKFRKGQRYLRKLLAKRNETIPPLINVYMGLSETMKTFGTAVNPDFGEVEETGIIIKLDDIYKEKRARHIHDESISKEALKLNTHNSR